MESIHARIKRLRKARGLSLEKFAAAVGVKWQSAQQWEKESGGTAPTRKRQERVARALGITVAELMGQSLPVSAQEPTASYGDPRVKRLSGLFYWLTEDEKNRLMEEVEAMATANRAIAKEIGPKLKPVSDARVEQALKKRSNNH